jgi:hypothetical protein
MTIYPKRRSGSSWVINTAVAFSITFILLASENKTSAQSETQSPDASSSEFYTIEDEQTSLAVTPTSPDLSPINNFSLSGITAYARALTLNLLHWTLHTEAPNPPDVNYNRQFHFGGWINDPNDDTCFNTRAKVLIRDSEELVSFKENNHCSVEKGKWVDPYAGASTMESRDLQIDHMVPLKNAYISGAWRWSFKMRRLYANFMGNKFHLIAASGHENMSKGDKAPDRYMPPKESYRCQYLENWLKIKLIWKLSLTPSEAEAIRTDIKDEACDSRDFSLSTAELSLQRKIIYESILENNRRYPAH